VDKRSMSIFISLEDGWASQYFISLEDGWV